MSFIVHGSMKRYCRWLCLRTPLVQDFSTMIVYSFNVARALIFCYSISWTLIDMFLNSSSTGCCKLSLMEWKFCWRHCYILAANDIIRYNRSFSSLLQPLPQRQVFLMNIGFHSCSNYSSLNHNNKNFTLNLLWKRVGEEFRNGLFHFIIKGVLPEHHPVISISEKLIKPNILLIFPVRFRETSKSSVLFCGMMRIWKRH